MAEHYVFVYGTLKRGHSRHAALAGQRLVGNVVTEPIYAMYSLGDYPGLVRVKDGAGDRVSGEIYAVSSQCLAVLDEIEEVDQGLYERSVVEIERPAIKQPANEGKHVGGVGFANVETYFYLGRISQDQRVGRHRGGRCDWES